MSLLALLLALGGFAALALAMPRHYRAVLGRQPSRGHVLFLRLAGWALILASLPPCIAWLGNPVGPVAWFGVLNAAALLVAFSLTWARRASAR